MAHSKPRDDRTLVLVLPLTEATMLMDEPLGIAVGQPRRGIRAVRVRPLR